MRLAGSREVLSRVRFGGASTKRVGLVIRALSARGLELGRGLDLAQDGFVFFEPGRFFARLRHHEARFQDRRCVGFLDPEDEVPLWLSG
jgi:hypothetical protein